MVSLTTMGYLLFLSFERFFTEEYSETVDYYFVDNLKEAERFSVDIDRVNKKICFNCTVGKEEFKNQQSETALDTKFIDHVESCIWEVANNLTCVDDGLLLIEKVESFMRDKGLELFDHFDNEWLHDLHFALYKTNHVYITFIVNGVRHSYDTEVQQINEFDLIDALTHF